MSGAAGLSCPPVCRVRRRALRWGPSQVDTPLRLLGAVRSDVPVRLRTIVCRRLRVEFFKGFFFLLFCAFCNSCCWLFFFFWFYRVSTQYYHFYQIVSVSQKDASNSHCFPANENIFNFQDFDDFQFVQLRRHRHRPPLNSTCELSFARFPCQESSPPQQAA